MKHNTAKHTRREEERRRRRRRRELTAQFYRGNHFLFFVCVIFSLLMGGLNLVLSWMIQQLIDTISGSPNALHLPALSLLTVLVILLVVVFKTLDYFSKPRFFEKAMCQYKDYAFQKLTQKSIASFQDETTAAYLSAFSNDTASIETNLLEQQFTLVANGVMFFGALFMMLFYSPLLTAIAIVLSVLPFLASMTAGRRMEEAETLVSDKNASFVASLKDSLSGFSVIKSFRAEQAICSLFSKHNHDAENAKCHRRKLASLIGMIGSVAAITAQMGVFWAGTWMALSGDRITAGVVLLFVNLMNFIIDPIAQMPSMLANRRAALSLVDKLAAALHTHIRDQGNSIPNRLEDGITLEDASFGYEPNTPVLHHLSLRFEAQKSYAIVGTSGSGKSTLLNLLMAAHDDYTGTIRYDSHSLSQISSESLYDLVSVIQQNVFLFNASIRDNITMFRPFPKEDVDRVIQLSGLAPLIAQKGEDYLCGENGCGLSGGERQRISIARSLLRRCCVLLADEATASLDKETANHVANAILDLDGLTRIVVTHALDASQLRRYDCILTMKNGRLEEMGDFDTLMEQKGYFYSLYTVSA